MFEYKTYLAKQHIKLGSLYSQRAYEGLAWVSKQEFRPPLWEKRKAHVEHKKQPTLPGGVWDVGITRTEGERSFKWEQYGGPRYMES